MFWSIHLNFLYRAKLLCSSQFDTSQTQTVTVSSAKTWKFIHCFFFPLFNFILILLLLKFEHVMKRLIVKW